MSNANTFKQTIHEKTEQRDLSRSEKGKKGKPPFQMNVISF